MKKKSIGAIVAAALAVSLLAAPGASAATEIGDNCTAEGTLGAVTQLQIASAPGAALPLTAPSSGIVTQWKITTKIPVEYPQQLRIFRGSGKTFQTIAQSSIGTVRNGLNVFETRIPIQAGDRVGVFAPAPFPTFYCTSSNPADILGYFPGDAAVGTTNEYTEAASIKSPISAVIEPDADNDGFGDETQDKCPRSGAIQQVACPVITLGAFGRVKKGSAQILVSASSQAQVTVFGTVKLPKKGKKGKARKLTIQGGSQSVGAGSVVPFNLIFPPTLKGALSSLPSGRSLPLVVTTTTTDAAGQPSSHQLTLKLKGQKKGKAKAKGKAKKG